MRNTLLIPPGLFFSYQDRTKYIVGSDLLSTLPQTNSSIMLFIIYWMMAGVLVRKQTVGKRFQTAYSRLIFPSYVVALIKSVCRQISLIDAL